MSDPAEERAGGLIEQRVRGRVGADDPRPVIDGEDALAQRIDECVAILRVAGPAGLELFGPASRGPLTATTGSPSGLTPTLLRIAPIARRSRAASAATTTSAMTATIAASHASTGTSIAQALDAPHGRASWPAVRSGRDGPQFRPGRWTRAAGRSSGRKRGRHGRVSEAKVDGANA